MHNLIYLSTFYPYEKRDYLLDGIRSAANISASAFSYSVLSGLASNMRDGLYILNTPLTGPYPIDYRRKTSSTFITKEYGMKVVSIGSYNFYGVQGISLCSNLYKAMINLNLGPADILIYSIQLPLLKAAVKYKKKNKNSRIVLIVPDLYEFINSQSFLKQTFKKMIFGDFEVLCEDVDGYVLLTEQMIEKMPVRKPYCVVEGIYNPSEQRCIVSQSSEIFTVLYTGMLYEKFGVKNLVDAICSLKIDNLRLQLCGSGDLKDYIIEKASMDSRIEYLGIVSRERVLELQSKASLLVNPRQPNGGFTCYSFPSKNIEYLASCTPTLLYELEGIPQEYYKYCYHLSARQSSVEELISMIIKIYETPLEERISIAKKAHEFICSKKNAPAQCQKIIQFIDNLSTYYEPEV